MTAQEIRAAYLAFFKDRGHAVIPRAQLVPDNDPTTLFTGSGMQPLIPYLLGEAHPGGTRLADSQPSLRAQDIEEVGDTRHTTFFEMLGNWSLGDYGKAEQIQWIFRFLTDTVGLDPSKLYVSCFIGSEEFGIPRDAEAAELWQKLFAEKGITAKIVAIGSQEDGDRSGMQGGRIFYYDDGENWWSRGGGLASTPVGDPCGPDSEVFYDFGEDCHDASFGRPHPATDSGRFMEIGNNVFMTYRKVSEKQFEPLDKPNIDHGAGLERIAAAAIDSPDVFKISLLKPIIEKLEEISGKTYASHTESMRVIADHLRAATFLAVDGVSPSNKTQGYVMRRLIRRAIRFAFDLGVEQNFLEQVVPVIADMYHQDFPEVAENRANIIQILAKEEKAFRQTLRKGLREFNKLFAAVIPASDNSTDQGELYDEPDSSLLENKKTSRREAIPESSQKSITVGDTLSTGFPVKLGMTAGESLFVLYDTYGFPLELGVEEAFKRGIDLGGNWQAEFDTKMQQQRARSQTAAKGTFKGGLGGQTLQHKKYHTATHLLQSALRELYGKELRQHGSNITEERLRFDFNLDRKMTAEEIKQAEDLVNGWIAEDVPVKFTEYPTKQALDMGAIGPFGERYGDSVKVYQMGPEDHIVSLEICGGPHVEHTGQLAEEGKTFKISKEEASSAGIRRVKAVLQ